MVQPAEAGLADQGGIRRRTSLDLALVRCVLGETEMSPVLLVVRDVPFHEPEDMLLAEGHHVIQQDTATRSRMVKKLVGDRLPLGMVL